MLSADPSPLIVGLNQEEVTAKETLTFRRYKVNSSVRPNRSLQCRRRISQRESGPSERDCASGGDEWQPSASSVSLKLPNQVRTSILPPSAASGVSTDELNTSNSVSTSIDVFSSGALPESFTSVVRRNKCEFCGKDFTRSGRLKRHIDCVHKTLRPYACEICGRSFAEMGHLRRHINCLHKTPQWTFKGHSTHQLSTHAEATRLCL
uniref:Zinc finger and BTB domain-containing protein 17 n=1 Tax=Schistocephalus solidus TaxID=70667 RepID=A0A0X3P7N2_SCHSO